MNFLGREFIGNRPARSTRGKSQFILGFQVIDLEDDPVNFVTNFGTDFTDMGNKLLDFIQAAQGASIFADRQSPLTKLVVPLQLAGGRGETGS